jgi:hypothetical protein
MPPVNVTQVPSLTVAANSAAPVNETQIVHISVTSGAVAVNMTQLVQLVICDHVEFVPDGSFGALFWYEFDSSDGVTRVWSAVDLPDDPTYYHGMKDGIVLQPGTVVRAVSSDDDGSYESQRAAVQVSDMSRYLRGLLGQVDARRNFVGRTIRLRMIDLPTWRAHGLPRTVAIGIVRGYTTE